MRRCLIFLAATISVPIAAAAQPTLSFRPAAEGAYAFDTGVVRGRLNNQGLAPLVHISTGTELASGTLTLMSYYRVFSSGTRYGDRACLWPAVSTLLPDGSVRITGTKGTCHLDNCRIEGQTKWSFAGPENNPTVAEQKALIEAVRSGTPINAGHYMINSTMVGVMGQIACYTGQPVTWEEVCKSDLQYGPPPEHSTFDTLPPVKPDSTGNYPLPMPGITKLS